MKKFTAKKIAERQQELAAKKADLMEEFRGMPEAPLEAIKEFRRSYNYYRGADDINTHAHFMDSIQEFFETLREIEFLDWIIKSKKERIEAIQD